MAISVELLVNSSAWHAASRPTLRFCTVHYIQYPVKPMDYQDPRYLRGARSFLQGRFESVARETFDDGWTPEEPRRSAS